MAYHKDTLKRIKR